MKNTTKVIIFVILVVLLVNIGLYSAAAFVNWEWNPKLWDAPTRFILVLFSVPLSIGMGKTEFRDLNFGSRLHIS